MKKIVLVKIEQESETNHPLALLFLVNSLRKSNFETKILLGRTQNFDPDVFVQKIIDQDPLFVGFSSITGRQTYDNALVCRALKKRLPNIITLWGGIHTSLVPEQTLKEKYIDFIIKGEGEETIAEFAKMVASKKNEFHKIPGLGYKENDEIIINEDREFVHMPDYELEEEDFEHINVEDAIYTDPTSGDRMFSLQTSRGCPFNCGFCYSARFTKRRMRYFEPEAIERMGKILHDKYGVTGVQFTDDNIYFKYDRVFDIVKRLQSVGITSRYLQTRIEDITEKSLNDLSSIGVRRLFFGIETGSQSTKVLIDKKISNDLIKEKVRLIGKHKGMGITCAMILGFPTETEESINETIKFGIELTKIYSNTLITFQTYMPFPGTDLYQLAVGAGYEIPKNPFEYKELDSMDGDIDIKWASYNGLSGTDLALKLNLINKYACLLSHGKGTSWVRTLGKYTLAYFARFRLTHDYYRFPFEIGLLARYNRYINHFYKDKGGVVYLKNRYQILAAGTSTKLKNRYQKQASQKVVVRWKANNKI